MAIIDLVPMLIRNVYPDFNLDIKKLVTINNSLDLNWYPSIWKYINGDGSWSYETDLDHD